MSTTCILWNPCEQVRKIKQVKQFEKVKKSFFCKFRKSSLSRFFRFWVVCTCQILQIRIVLNVLDYLNIYYYLDEGQKYEK